MKVREGWNILGGCVPNDEALESSAFLPQSSSIRRL